MRIKSRKYPGLYLRGKRWWMEFEYNGVRVHKTTKQSDESLAAAVMENAKQALMDEAFQAAMGASNRMTLQEGIDTLETEKLQGTGNHQVALACLRKIERILGADTDLAGISTATFKHLKGILRKEGCADSTINRYFSYLNSVLTHAHEEHDIDCPKKITSMHLKEGKHRVRVISDHEETMIREWLATYRPRRNVLGWSNQDWLDIFDVFMHTGMRRGELFSFTVGDIRGDSVIFHEHKTMDHAGEKSVALNRTARSVIERRIQDYGLTHTDRVFPYSGTNFTRLWKRMKDDLGLSHDDEFVVHCLRHTFASRLAAKGATLYDVSKLLGHSTIQTTERYAHLFNEQLVQTACMLD